MTRDMAALHADLKLYGAVVTGGERTTVWVYADGRAFHVYDTTRQDSGTLTKGAR